MKELTFEEFCDLPITSGWRFSLDSGSLTYYANKSVGLTISIFILLRRKFGWQPIENKEKHYENK